jgi:BirA family biotin operon repressor/biotin-[acetyl-CoA-carboxylase] ligase
LPGKCLTLSIILCSPSYAALGPNLGQLAACAVRDVLDHYGLRACLKWPNDIMVSDRKIAGILVDQDPGRPFYVVGMGLNVNLTAAELAGAGIDRPATSMHDATGREFRASDVLRTLLDKLALRMAQAETTGLRPLWEIWAQNDWLEHRSIRVVGHETQLEGEYLGVDEVGRLKLRTPDGEERALWTGDVEQVRSLGVDQAFAGRPLGVLKTG